MNKNKCKNRRGQGLIEYIIVVASVAMISLVAVSVFGHKVADQYAIGAGMLPCGHAEHAVPIATGEFAGVTSDGTTLSGNGQVAWTGITGLTGTSGELVNNVVSQGNNGGDAFVSD